MDSIFSKVVQRLQTPEGKAEFAKVIVRNRIEDILFGYKTGHLTKEKAVSFIEEIIADHKEVK